jgi:threonine/homoserine/homoserine lactone efflux protein
MNYELLTGLMIFALVSTITPGPNTLMLMASGANYGFRRSSPHVLGVGLGFALMVILVGAGLLQLFDAYPVSYQILKTGSVSYLLYLAYRTATTPPVMASSGQSGKPFTFMQAALYQWVNPKAWTMALTAISVYSPSQNLGAITLVAAIFGAIALPSVSLWAVVGQNLRRILASHKRMRAFNISMAVLLVASLYPAISP